MEKDYLVMDDGGIDISSEELTPEMKKAMDAAFEAAMEKIQS